MSFKLKMKVLLFLVSSVVSFSAQNENFQMNIKNNDVKNDTIDDNYFSFNAVHIHLNENSNFFNPARLHYNNCIAPSSFISNNPNENQSHFIFVYSKV